MIGDDFIHPSSFFIVEPNKALSALVRWDIGQENGLFVFTPFDTIGSSYRQLRDFWRQTKQLRSKGFERPIFMLVFVGLAGGGDRV